MSSEEAYRKHYVAVIGGSISGSEGASLLAQNGFRVVVFDMNKLPYGKIEDGLPKWHINLRNRQIKEIDAKLAHKNIRFVPLTKIGKDISFYDLVNNWGFSAVILANGAWMDRPLPINGIEKYVDSQLVYQNAFLNWYNHEHEPDYEGMHYPIRENTLVIGGGLASLDVIKIIMIELVKNRLKEIKGIDIDMFTIEKYGIDKVLSEHGLTFDDLKISKAKLAYRRTARDMPLKEPRDDSEEAKEAARDVSEKLLSKYVEKFQFEFLPLSAPVGFTESDGQLSGIRFQRTAVSNGKLQPVPDNFYEVKTDLVISSIGSIPEQIKGLQYEGSALKMSESDNECLVYGYDNIFAIGNAVTGRGNIQESKQHGKQMTEKIIDKHLTEDAFEKWLIEHNKHIQNTVKKQIDSIVKHISGRKLQPENIIQAILDRTHSIHEKIGYTTYEEWVKQKTPVRMEDILENKKSYD